MKDLAQLRSVSKLSLSSHHLFFHLVFLGKFPSSVPGYIPVFLRNFKVSQVCNSSNYLFIARGYLGNFLYIFMGIFGIIRSSLLGRREET
jgi:hypothetical protein